MLEEKNIFSVTTVNNIIKNLIENDNQLKYVYIRGEVSNSKLYGNGNFYFTLKDQESAISAVLFSNYLSKLKVLPKDGDQIIVLGSLTVFNGRGTYQVRVYDVFYDGEGQLLLQLEILKKRLEKEGLFDVSKKRLINKMPRKIGIVTSYPSAACEDLIKNITRRLPSVRIFIFPSLVQGVGAPKELISALDKAYNYDLDTLIIARGGGSVEDLWAFNDENLIRKLALSPIPTVSAIGHEIDFTLCDFVCDARASTPTGAAELVTIDQNDIILYLDEYEKRLSLALSNKLTKLQNKFELLKVRFNTCCLNIIKERKNKINELDKLLNNAINSYINNIGNKVTIFEHKLNALSPLKVLERGYSLLQDEEGKVITSINDISVGQVMKTTLKDGTINLSVISKELKYGEK
ncbi:MAG: exodeoxyribonuclease VII large subunit [Bacilli bacterium]